MAETKTRPKPKGAKPKAPAKKAAKKKVKQIKGEFRDIEVVDLEFWPGNARLSDMDNLVESIELNGFITPVVVQKSSSFIIVGNHRVEAAKILGIETVPCRVVEMDDEEAERYVLADNAASDKGSYDEVKLGSILGGILESGEDALAGTGYSPKEAKDWVAAAEWNSEEADDDDVAAVTDEATKETVAAKGAKKIEGSKTRKQAIEDLGVRTMMLSFKLKQYPHVQDAIEKGMKKYGVDTSVDVVVQALAKAKLLDLEAFNDAAPDGDDESGEGETDGEQ